MVYKNSDNVDKHLINTINTYTMMAFSIYEVISSRKFSRWCIDRIKISRLNVAFCLQVPFCEAIWKISAVDVFGVCKRKIYRNLLGFLFLEWILWLIGPKRSLNPFQFSEQMRVGWCRVCSLRWYINPRMSTFSHLL